MASTLDLYGVPVFETLDARKKSWSSVVNQIQNLNINIRRGDLFGDLTAFVYNGFLSPQSASYLLVGRASPHSYVVLESFKDFLTTYESIFGYIKQNNLQALWQKRFPEIAAAESTFLFPLAELASKTEDFSDETAYLHDNDLRDLQKL